MLEATGNLFDYVGQVDALCITTNGFVKNNGKAVMGRGCAQTAKQKWPEIDFTLGQKIIELGNCVHPLGITENTVICSFPVKPITTTFNGTNVVKHMVSKFKIGEQVPGWAAIARKDIIQFSAQELVALADKYNWQTVVLPRPGCGAGELRWGKIEPLLQKYLDNRFTAVTFR